MEYFIVIFLILFSALFSGLTLGFFSLNKDDLKRKVELGDKQAKKIYKIRKNGNLLLCTLLIGNVAVNSTLSIFLGSIASGFVAGLTATFLIVVFGEIIPQSVFSRYALILGAKFAWLVKLFIIMLFPICWPIAWLLDKILGNEMPNIYSKIELARIIEEHEDLKESEIDADEEKILKGALSYSEKTTQEIMTPRTEVILLKCDQILNKKAIDKIKNSGHSRIPVYKKDQDDIIGILYVKDLIGENLKNRTTEELCRKGVIFVDYNKSLDDLLNEFKKRKHHLFVVLNKFGGVSGIVTIEDVLEEIIGAEIMDEFDKYEDLQKVAKIKALGKKRNKV
ncbi:HlyC/CorC family transporter [Candidatus Parcubacteria bacterium]|nr:HlyC/CorC family transporter [Candidatus Parcubacteria bacterium]